MNIIDLTLMLDGECMTCGTPWHEKVKIEKMGTLETVGRNTSRFVLGSHSGTHMDAPLHFINGMHGVDKNDLNICIGHVNCVDFTCKQSGDVIDTEDIKGINVSQRMLFVFGWNKHWKTPRYYDKFPYFTEKAIRYLIDSGMKLIALDTPSPDDGNAIHEKADSPIHHILLKNDVIIVEYLTNTEQIDFKMNYEIMALPLKIKDADGAPARVILREVENG